MQYFISIIFTFSLFFSTACSPTAASSRFYRQISVDADKVARWQMDNFNYCDSGNLHDYGIDAWTNGVFYVGLARWAAISTESDFYYDWLYNDIGMKNNWQIPANFIDDPKYGIYHADELCVGQFYIEMYKKYQRPEMITPVIRRLDRIIHNLPDSSMSFRNKQTWSWCDALFMAPPVYLGVAELVNEPEYTDFMHTHYKATYRHLFDLDEKLFYRDDSYFDQREANGEKIFWGRGNGWVMAGLANILRLLPESDPERAFYVELLVKMAERVLLLQHPDGYWQASLLDPDSYPSPETSATALITYALAYGVNNNYLPKETYGESIKSAWSFLLSVIDENGKLGWVQPIGADPKSVTAEMTAVYGVGAFLLAASELYQLYSH